jgi:hypothetical protein
MATVRDNTTRVKRFRELKATLRTDRTRLLVGLDIAQTEHVVPQNKSNHQEGQEASGANGAASRRGTAVPPHADPVSERLW